MLNAGAAIYAGGAVPDFAAGVTAAREAIADGSAAQTLERLHRRDARTGGGWEAGMNGNVLERIVESTRDEVRRRQASVPLRELEQALAHRDDRPFSEGLTRPGVSLIAEHKRRSPSAGTIREGATVGDVVRAYELGGAAAVSILTEGAHFAGSLDDLREARESSHHAGAAQGLHRRRLPGVRDRGGRRRRAAAHLRRAVGPRSADLYGEAQALDLDVLVEVHDERELELALEAIDADVIGINNRDLTDFSVDLDRTYELLSEVPAGKTVVSESGIHSRDQLDDLERVGVDAVLVGEALMRATDMADAVRTLVGHETL